MLTATDRFGRSIDIEDDDEIPSGAVLHVPVSLMDGRAVHKQRAFLRDAAPRVLHAPGYVQSVMADGFAATNSNERSQSASEIAREAYVRRISNAWQAMPRTATRPRPLSYDPGDAAQDSADASEQAWQRMKARLADEWRTPARDDDPDDNATMGIQRADAPDDIQQMSLAAQNALHRGVRSALGRAPG
jgi:hypothetical protein